MLLARKTLILWFVLFACAFATAFATSEAALAETGGVISAQAGIGGAITPSGDVAVELGFDQTFTIEPSTGYHITDVVVDGGSVGAVTSHMFTNVTTDHTISASFAINAYAITVTSGAHGSITPGTGNVAYGSSPTYAITADTGYHIATLTVDGVSQLLQDSWTFLAVDSAHSLAATFAIDTYAITVTPGANGTITPGTGAVDYGSSPVYTITPDTGYHVADVLVDGSSVGAVTSHTFSNVTGVHTISASFAINTYAMTVTPGANGTITPGTGPVDYGSSPTYTITPNTGYHVADVVVDGDSVGAVTSHTFTNVTATHTISAGFAIDTYTITPSAGANGSILPATTQTVDWNGSQTFTIGANTGYHVADVLVDGGSVGAVTSYTFDNVTANHTIAASFAIDTYAITVAPGAHGSISPGTGSVDYGSSPRYTITPETGYHVADVIVDGSSIGAVTSHTFTNVTGVHSISATFAVYTYTITPSAGAHGSILPATTQTVDWNGRQSFTITPSTGYHVSDVLVDGGSVGAVTSYTFDNVTANHTIDASFAIDTHTITVTPGAHGSITPGTGAVDHGTSPVYAITPETGYHVADVIVDGVSVGAVTSRTFSNVTGGHSISATFAINTYAITISAGAHGSVSPAGPVTVNHGGDLTLSFLPDASYRVSDVTVDGVSQGALPSYTFSRVTGAHGVSVTFVQGLATRLQPRVGSTTVTYGDATSIGAKLLRSDDGTPITGGSVALWASSSVAGPWALVDTVTTSASPGAEGTCSVRVVPQAGTFYSLRYTPAPGSSYAAALSPILLVNVRPALGAPSGPSTVKVGKRFSVSGTLSPRLASGSAGVQIRVYRQKGKKWRPFSRVVAAIADSGDVSRYSARVKLTEKGVYRFRAEFPAVAGWASGISKSSANTKVR